MKSRLIPSPTADDREPRDAAQTVGPQRRESDMVTSIDEVTEALTAETTTSEVVDKAPPVPRSAPQVSARPNGRLIVAAVLLLCVGSTGYSLWSTFLRDAAYGTVSGDVTKISPPWTGTVTAIYASAGSRIEQGDVLAVVEDPELIADIERVADELRTAQAELDSQAAIIALKARQRDDEADQVKANYFDLRGELAAEQSRLAELNGKLERRHELRHKRAYSEEEIESLTFLADGLTGKIENLKQAVATLESRLTQFPTVDDETAQLKPWLSRIETAQSELLRLRNKQQLGTIRAPLSGVVVETAARVGQRIEASDSLLELLPTDSVEVVLYVQQADLDNYELGQKVAVVVEPLPEPISCRLVRIGHRLQQPQSAKAGRYQPTDKLVPLHFELEDPTAQRQLRLGSTVRLPTTYFEASP